MTKNKSNVDKNLQNVVKSFDQEQRKTNDRRHQDKLNNNTDPGGKFLLDKE